MKVRWTLEAQKDRIDIWTYIVEHDADAAARVDLLFSESVAKLADFPLLGHAGEVAGTRELTPHRNYRLVYDVGDDVIWVLALVHASRRWPPLR